MMLFFLVLSFLFTSSVTCSNVTSTVSTILNQTFSEEKDKFQTFSPMMDVVPFFNYNGRTPFSSPFSHYYSNKGLYNPRNTAIQFPTDHFPYIYDSNPNFGYPVAEHETAPSLKPTARHFVIVSFIGLLLLFAVIQNTMEATRRKTALVEVLSSREKRDLSVIHNLNNMTPEEEDIFNDDTRLRCLQWMVCLQNRKLLQDFGTSGKIFAKYLTRQLKKMFSNSSGWSAPVEDAGRAGYYGEDCNILYRDCN